MNANAKMLTGKKTKFLTHNGEVESGLPEAILVPQLDGVASAVLLLSAGDGQQAAAVRTADGRPRRPLLDLRTGHARPTFKAAGW